MQLSIKQENKTIKMATAQKLPKKPEPIRPQPQPQPIPNSNSHAAAYFLFRLLTNNRGHTGTLFRNSVPQPIGRQQPVTSHNGKLSPKRQAEVSSSSEESSNESQ